MIYGPLALVKGFVFTMGLIQKLEEKRIQKKTEAFKKAGMLRYFHYDFGSMAEGITSYTVSQEGDELLMIYQMKSMKDGTEVRSDVYMPLTVMQQIKALLMNENIFLWNGFNKSNSVIATGNSFLLKADFDNYRLKAEGMTMTPPAYDEKHEVLVGFLRELVMTYYTEISQE